MINLVANDAKPVALQYPMESKAIDEYWDEFLQTAEKYNVDLYREDDADTKAVEIEWQITNFDTFKAYALQFWQKHTYSKRTFIGPEKYIYRISQ